MVEKSRRPPEVALVERLLGELHDAVDAAERLDVALGECFGRVRPQPRGVAVEPAHVALIDRLHVMADRTVVTVGVPRLLERGRHPELLGDLGTGVALIEQPQRLVVQVRVQIALGGQELDDAFAAPRRPVVRRERDVHTVGEVLDCLGEVARPDVRVADQRAAQRQQVVQVVSRVLRHAQCAVTREVEVHLGGRLGARRHLELDLDAVDRVLFAGRVTTTVGVDHRDLTGRRALTQPAADLALRAAGNRVPYM